VFSHREHVQEALFRSERGHDESTLKWLLMENVFVSESKGNNVRETLFCYVNKWHVKSSYNLSGDEIIIVSSASSTSPLVLHVSNGFQPSNLLPLLSFEGAKSWEDSLHPRMPPKGSPWYPLC